MAEVLYLGPLEQLPNIKEELQEHYVRAIPPERSKAEAVAGEIDAVLDASMKLPFSADFLSRFEQLKLMVTATTGADHIDAAELERRGIPLLTLKGQHEVLNKVNAAAELSWLLLMACARKLRPAVQHVEEGGWDRTLFPGRMLRGKTLGIIGCGRNGQWMARYAHAFEMRVLGFDTILEQWPEKIERRDLPEVLAESDFLTLHVPLNEETSGMIGREELEKVKHGVILINTSRGAVVDEEALVEALEEGRVASFGFDVLVPEPAVQRSLLWSYARHHHECLITPHIGGFSPDALEVVLRFSAGRIREYFQ